MPVSAVLFLLFPILGISPLILLIMSLCDSSMDDNKINRMNDWIVALLITTFVAICIVSYFCINILHKANI
ncbi:MAG: hypothetical protein PHE29_09915 [Tissierellia bacterium]|nr:hypothetical protein [Tissierellia bacterium]